MALSSTLPWRSEVASLHERNRMLIPLNDFSRMKHAMQRLYRTFDIQPLMRADMTIELNGQPVSAAIGETVLTVIQSLGVRQVARNDHDQISGAYCGMGVCQCCLVKINGRHKRRACQTLVQPGMQVETAVNRIAEQEAL